MVSGGMLDRGCVVYYGSHMLDDRGNIVYSRGVVDDRGVMVFLPMLLLMVDFVADEGLGGGCVSVTV